MFVLQMVFAAATKPHPSPSAFGTPSPAEAAAGGAFLGVGLIFLIFLGILGVGIYFIPSIIGFARHKQNAVAIFALNFFLGWSFIGWIIAMVWALANESPAQQVVVYHQAPATPNPEQRQPPSSSSPST